jgi:uncharacterized SAM-binding protein YcdF (DUF218 family)
VDVTTSRIIEALLLPPGSLILLAIIGLFFWRSRFGRWILTWALLLQWLLSLPVTADLLYLGLEYYPPLNPAEIKATAPEAIVVLGGGRDLNAPEYGGDTISERGLMRLRYAAKIAKQTGLPIIPSGGNPGAIGVPEAKISRDILRNEFAVEVQEIEPHSNTTWENARYTAQLMKRIGVQRIILVTDAAHMARALYAFERNGIRPLPAPTNYQSIVSQQVSPIERYLPSGLAVRDCSYAIHEYLGLFWYRLK